MQRKVHDLKIFVPCVDAEIDNKEDIIGADAEGKDLDANSTEPTWQAFEAYTSQWTIIEVASDADDDVRIFMALVVPDTHDSGSPSAGILSGTIYLATLKKEYFET